MPICVQVVRHNQVELGERVKREKSLQLLRFLYYFCRCSSKTYLLWATLLRQMHHYLIFEMLED